MTTFKGTVIYLTICTRIPVDSTTMTCWSVIIEITILDQTVYRFFKPFHSTSKIGSATICNVTSDKLTANHIGYHINISTIFCSVMIYNGIADSVIVTLIVNTSTIVWCLIVGNVSIVNDVFLTINPYSSSIICRVIQNITVIQKGITTINVYGSSTKNCSVFSEVTIA